MYGVFVYVYITGKMVEMLMLPGTGRQRSSAGLIKTSGHSVPTDPIGLIAE
jgi:hypothetical protein